MVSNNSLNNSETLWDKRYTKEGAIWGWEPSETAKLLAEKLAPASKVLEVGFGYGRDIAELVKEGHFVHGLEESTVGLNLAVQELKKFGLSNKSHLTFGEFTSAALPQEYFDAIYSHRVLHLLKDNGLVRAFANSAARGLKSGGLLFISARDERDFDPEQMIKLEDGRAAYKDTVKGREGHIISFWSEERFEKTFSKKFKILSFVKGQEIESSTNPGKMSHYTIMMAEKKDLSF
ncbi:MAG: class I SAM-dependent methyltransferase [Alphaproteobacteria bacterium]|nr:class I SAM-dependent methyltransferase [Alphaproteobacteria bacterium]